MSIEKFVAKTLDLIRLEREAEIEETRILTDNVPPKILERRGVCLLRLHISARHMGLFGRTVLAFESTKEMPAHSMNPGDIVGLSISSADTPQEVISSGVVSKVNQSAISVAFDESQDLFDLDDSASYKLVKLANDVTYKRLKKAMDELLSSDAATSLINVLFGISEIGTALQDPPGMISDDMAAECSSFFYNNGLDASQREAVRFALCQREVTIVHGPPGTGKTTTVIEIIRQAVRTGLKVLACAPSNIAVDNLVERLSTAKVKVVRLGHPARLLPTIQRHSLDAILASSDETRLVEDVRNDINKALLALKRCRNRSERAHVRDDVKSLRRELRQREDLAVRDILTRASVVLATLTTASRDGPLGLLESRHFDLVVIDECAQAVEAACWIALLRGKRCILAGDHQQLPPTIISDKAAKDGLQVTLMERLLTEHSRDVTENKVLGGSKVVEEVMEGGAGRINKDSKIMRMLTVQYRMHEDIMSWSSRQLYGGHLEAHPSVARHLLKDLPGVKCNEDTALALLLIDTVGCDLNEIELSDGVSKGNEGEADLAAAHVDRLIASGVAQEDIAVIAPYNLQVELLRLRLVPKFPRLEVKSVDGFQGREKEAVVITLVRSNQKGEVGFLSEDRRINVAVTRARRHVALVCDSDTISHHGFLQTLIEHITHYGEVRSAEQYIQDGALSSTEIRSDEITERLKMTANGRVRAAGKAASSALKKMRTKQSVDAQTLKHPAERRKEEDLRLFEDDSRKQELTKMLEKFLADKDQTVYVFPTSLTSRDRFLVHEIAESLGLVHISRGDTDQRCIEVRKEVAATKWVSTISAEASSMQSTTSFPISKNSSDARNTKSNNTKEAMPQFSELIRQNLNDRNKKANGIISCESQTNCEIRTAVSNSVATNYVASVTPCDKSMIHDTNISASPACDGGTLNVNVATTRCTLCGASVPTSNSELHELRCKKKFEKKKHQTASASGSSASAAVPALENDFDAIVAAAALQNRRCTAPRCKNSTATLGMDCAFCRQRFCLTHHLAEAHGCGEAAKRAARATIAREGVLYAGSGVPSKLPDPIRRAHLERRLEKKMNDMKESRAPASAKQKEKKGK